MNRKIVEEIAPYCDHLHCDTCGRDAVITDMAGYLAYGWPACCGYTMRLVTKIEQSKPGGEV